MTTPPASEAPATAVRPTPGRCVRYGVDEGVAEIVLDRPEKANSIDLETARQLTEALESAGADDAVRAVLLRGEGKLFCSGGDLAAMGAAPDRSAFVFDLASGAHQAVRALDRLAKPVVVAVQGSAAGIGFSLALGADLVIAGRSAKFVTAYTTVGLTPDGGLSWLLPRSIGQRRATELLLTSAPVAADRAEAFGIVSQICADADVLATARETSRRLAARPTHALGAARQLVRTSWGRDLTDHLDLEAKTIADAASTEATATLIAGFLRRE